MAWFKTLIPKNKKRRPRRSGKRSSGGSSLSNQNSITKFTGRAYATLSYSTASDALTISEVNLLATNLGDRAAAMADMFMYWRMVKLRIKAFVKTGRYVLTAATSNAQSLAETHSLGIAFVPISNADYTAPTTISQMIDFPEFKFSSGRNPVSLHVGRNGLIGSMMTKWLSTNNTVDGVLQSAGTATFFLVSPIGDTAANASIAQIMYEFDLEFKTPTDTATLPSLFRKEKQPREVTNFAWSRTSEHKQHSGSWDFDSESKTL